MSDNVKNWQFDVENIQSIIIEGLWEENIKV